MGQFKLLKEKFIGEGGYGRVYQCLWRGNLAAAKVFNVILLDNLVEVLHEIVMTRELRSDYIIQFFGMGHHNGKLCLITSYAENGSLCQALQRHILSHEQKSSIITGLIRGMQYLRSSNVIHRDFKSPNVLLDKNYVPKICDFGLAKLRLNSITLNKPSLLVGSVRWMAPELFEVKPHYSFASDMYALGMVIWEIFTEQLPYADFGQVGTLIDLIKKGTHQEIPDSIPKHYKYIIKKSWHSTPEARITIEEVSQVNDEVLQPVDTECVANMANYDTLDFMVTTNNDYVHVSAQQQPTDLSHFSVPDMEVKSMSTYYAIILDKYLLQTFGDLDSSYQLASLLNSLGDDFAQWIKSTAEQGDDAAITVLGAMHFHGCGASQDYQTALSLFSKAAKEKRTLGQPIKKGNSCALNSLGWMYDHGQGVLRYPSKAVEWYTKASDQGNTAALNNLGWMYVKGRGVKRNNSKAVELFTKAAEQGNVNAQNSLGWMYRYGRDVTQNDEKAAEWFTKAAEKGHTCAENNLGWMYMKGEGVPKNDSKAIELFTKAATKGNASAQNGLGWLFRLGQGVQHDDSKAAEWFAKAAEKGFASAQSNLAWMYLKGLGVQQNEQKAIELYEKAAAQGNENAQSKLHWIYKHGLKAPQCDDKSTER